jgi:HKD family nuclease
LPRTLIGNGEAVVVGLPVDFVLAKVLKKADKVRLATAFAHTSGWKHFRDGIGKSTSSVYLLTGLECCQTEPKLLKEWLDLQSKNPKRVEAKLASPDTFFHPKVVIVTFAEPNADFAIVGSGNLSQGGIASNTECSVYIKNRELLEQLLSWFDTEFSREAAVRLTKKRIEAYEPSYKRNIERRKKLDKEQQSAQKRVLSATPQWDWDEGLQVAKKYFATSKFRDKDYPSRKKGAADILKALKYPDFTFDKKGFKEFFEIGALGWLNPIKRDKIFQSATRIKNGLRALVTGGESRLPDVLNADGKFYVPGFRLNAVTKFLAAYKPKTWPLFNKRVQLVLNDFGYPKPHGFSTTDQYLAYREAMQKFMNACSDGHGELDALALDCFFLHHSRYVEKQQAKSKSL